MGLLLVNGSVDHRQGVTSLLAQPLPPAAEETDITGIYRCDGKNPNGTRYVGIVAIEKRGSAYALIWLIGDAPPIAGVGVRDGVILATTYANRTPQGIGVAVTAYRIEKGPKLIGRFTELGGKGSVRTETLTFMKKLEERDASAPKIEP
jgi:hypothetical protein